MVSLMKRCSYCGKRYGNKVEVCPVDQIPLEQLEDTPQRSTISLGPALPAFNATVSARRVSSGPYRIYLRGDDLLFIQTEPSQGSKGLEVLMGLLGPAGSLVALALGLLSKKKIKHDLSRIDERDPDDLLKENERNFTLYIPEIRDAVMKPPDEGPGLPGARAGRLELRLADGRKMKLVFPAAGDAKIALDVFARRLPSTLRIEHEPEKTGNRFEIKVRRPGQDPRCGQADTILGHDRIEPKAAAGSLAHERPGARHQSGRRQRRGNVRHGVEHTRIA